MADRDDLFPDVSRETKSDDDLKKQLTDYFSNSVGTDIDDDIMKERVEALRTFYREPYGNERAGWSRFITSDAMDTVNWLLPCLMNVFLSQPKAVEFVPSNKDSIDEAEQMTDYINYLAMEENNAFSIFYIWFWDALVTKNGFLKYYYKEEVKTVSERYTGISEAQVAALMEDPAIEIESLEQNGTVIETVGVPALPIGIGGTPEANLFEENSAMLGQQGPVYSLSSNPVPMPPQQPQQIEKSLFDVSVRRTYTDKQIKMENIAPSNIMVHNKATCIEDAKFIGIIYYKTKSDLLNDGFTEKDLADLPLTTNTEPNSEAEVRNDVNNISDAFNSTKYYEIIECYAQIAGKDGKDRLHRIILCDRNAKYILEDIEVDEIPIATITPFIKPYSFFGTSVVDLVKDLQLMNTSIWRNLLDYMYVSVQPQWEVVDRAIVNKDDVLHRVPGALIRTKVLGSIQPIQQPQFPTDVVSLLDRLRDVKDIRTGVTAFNMGLNPDALKANTATAGVEMAAAGRQIQDLIARTFAETGIKRLYRGLYGLVVKNANEKKVIRLRGSFVEIDPTTWRLPVNVAVNVGLGTGTAKTKVNDLQQLLALQLQFMPYRITNEKNLYNTMSRLVTTLGYKDLDSFITDPDQVPPPEPKPTPEEVALQQIQADLQKEQIRTAAEKYQTDVEAGIDKYQTDVKAEVELTKLNVDTALKQEALSLKYSSTGKSSDSRTDYFPGVPD